ncbi:hypothetical protein AGLY_008672, partial [Aphis glycines]
WIYMNKLNEYMRRKFKILNVWNKINLKTTTLLYYFTGFNSADLFSISRDIYQPKRHTKLSWQHQCPSTFIIGYNQNWDIILTKYTCALYSNEQLCEESNTKHTTSHLISCLVKLFSLIGFISFRTKYLSCPKTKTTAILVMLSIPNVVGLLYTWKIMISTQLGSSNHLYLYHVSQISVTKSVHLCETAQWYNIYLLLNYKTNMCIAYNFILNRIQWSCGMQNCCLGITEHFTNVSISGYSYKTSSTSFKIKINKLIL